MANMFPGGGGDSCGPSNPLQQLQKHTAQDRTLQQESSQRFAASGFRSAPRSADPRVEREFAQFTAGAAPSVHSEMPHAAPRVAPSSDWSADFARMQIAPQESRQTPQWHEEFARQAQTPHSGVQSIQPVAQTHSASYAAPQSYRPLVGSGAAYSQLGQFQTTPNVAQMSEHRQTHVLEAQQELFAQAFAQVEASIAKNDVAQEAQQAQQAQGPETVAQPIEVMDAPVAQQVEKSATDVENEAFAKVAGHVAQAMENPNATVSEQTAEKFKNSQFLSLMQQVRARQVQINESGSDLVDGSGNSVGTAAPVVAPTITHKEASEAQRTGVRDEPLGDPLAGVAATGMSSFAAAQQAMGGKLQGDGWEEVYEEYANDDNLII